VIRKLLPRIVVPVLLLGWLATGFYKVEPEELAVVKRFGAVVDGAVPSGLHWRLPAPFESHEKFQTTTVYKMGVGMITRDYLRGIPSPEELSLWMTGDTNILSLELMFQYTVVDLPEYLYRYEGAQFLMAMIAEAAVTEVLGSMGVDDALTSGRVLLTNAVRDRVQDRLEELQLGIAVSSVQLLSVDPPSQIIDVFRDVSNAAADRERIINDANGYANSVIPRARGEASWIVERAEADKNSRISEARGQSARFLSVLEEYRKNPDATRKRLYLETLEAVLPNVKRYVVDPGDDKRFDLKILDLGSPTAK